MSRRDSIILRASAGWTGFIWFVFVKNQLTDDTRSFGFKAVHFSLAVVSVGFAALTWRIASKNGRRSDSDSESHDRVA